MDNRGGTHSMNSRCPFNNRYCGGLFQGFFRFFHIFRLFLFKISYKKLNIEFFFQNTSDFYQNYRFLLPKLAKMSEILHFTILPTWFLFHSVLFWRKTYFNSKNFSVIVPINKLTLQQSEMLNACAQYAQTGSQKLTREANYVITEVRLF